LLTKLKAKFATKTANGSIMRNMMILASGTAMAQVFSFATMPVITRIYSPSDFGVLAIFVAIVSLLVPFATFRYSIAIPLPRRSQTAINLLALSMSVSFIVAIFLSVVLFFGADYIFDFFSVSILSAYWWLLPLALLGAGIYETLMSWSIREKQFKIIAKTKMTQSIASSIIKIVLGLLAFKPFGLLLGHTVAQVAGIGSIVSQSKDTFAQNKRYINLSRILFLAKRYSNFPKYQIASRFLLAFASHTPLMFVAFMYDSDATGQLALAFMVLGIPITLIGSSMGQAYYGEITKIGKKNVIQIKEITYSLTKKLFILSIVPFLILALFGELLFSFIFGNNWAEAGIFSSMLAVYLVAQFMSAPIINLFNLYEKQEKLFLFNLQRIILIVVIFTTAYIINLEINEVILIFSIAISIHYSLIVIYLLRIFKDV
jgi:O-antigen/teichoic acid export membrane protein